MTILYFQFSPFRIWNETFLFSPFLCSTWGLFLLKFLIQLNSINWSQLWLAVRHQLEPFYWKTLKERRIILATTTFTFFLIVTTALIQDPTNTKFNLFLRGGGGRTAGTATKCQSIIPNSLKIWGEPMWRKIGFNCEVCSLDLRKGIMILY